MQVTRQYLLQSLNKVENLKKLNYGVLGGGYSNERNISLKSSNSNLALNNYIQSSCVDISLMGFSSLLKSSNFPNSAKPIAVVHDDLVLDVKNSDLQTLEEIINKGINIDNLGKFYLGFESYE